jgi:hypothetical protein
MSAFQEAMRRVITGDDADGQSVVIIDGGPSSEIGSADLGGLFEIWEDAASGPLDPKAQADLGTRKPVLGPRPGNVQVRGRRHRSGSALAARLSASFALSLASTRHPMACTPPV